VKTEVRPTGGGITDRTVTQAAVSEVKTALQRLVDDGGVDPSTLRWLLRVITAIVLDAGLADDERLARALAKAGPKPVPKK
jgi:hypothetical protein